MKKKGFTLVELLAVIAILAILVIIALPNVLQMFNNAKKSAFKTEVLTVYKQAGTDFIKDSIVSSGPKYYCDTPKGNMDASSPDDCKSLNLTTTKKYYVEMDSKGNVIYLGVQDDSFSYGKSDVSSAKDIETEEVLDSSKYPDFDIYTGWESDLSDDGENGSGESGGTGETGESGGESGGTGGETGGSGATQTPVTFTVNGALGETINYTGTASGSFTLDSTGKKTVSLNPGTYTFTSSVAKNLSNTNSAYTKSVTITTSTTTVNFYPDGAIYWYGNGSVTGSSLYSKCGGIRYTYTQGNGTISGTANTITTIDTNRIYINKNYIRVYVPSGGNRYYSSAGCKNGTSKGSYTRARVYVEGGEYVEYYDSNNKYRFGLSSITFAGTTKSGSDFNSGKHIFTQSIPSSTTSVNFTLKYDTNILHNGAIIYAFWLY